MRKVNWKKILEVSAEKVDWENCVKSHPTVNQYENWRNDRVAENLEEMLQVANEFLNTLNQDD